MTIEQMRAELAKLYSGEKWQNRVKAMSNSQVVAIYKRNLEKMGGRK